MKNFLRKAATLLFLCISGVAGGALAQSFGGMGAIGLLNPTLVPQLTVNGGGTSQTFTLLNANNSVAFPVPGLQPVSSVAQNLALDLAPFGNPGDFAGNGVTYIDACNRDFITNGAQAFGCAHFASWSNGDAQVGTSAFNAATAGNVRLSIANVDQAVVVKTGGFLIGTGTPTTVQGELAFQKITASGTAPAAGFGKMELVCGTNAGSAKLIAYAGTSTTPVTVLDNIGSGVTGC